MQALSNPFTTPNMAKLKMTKIKGLEFGEQFSVHQSKAFPHGGDEFNLNNMIKDLANKSFDIENIQNATA